MGRGPTRTRCVVVNYLMYNADEESKLSDAANTNCDNMARG